MTEEGITGAFIRDLKGNTRTVCFVTGSGEHQIDDSDRDGLSQLQGSSRQGGLSSQGDQSAADRPQVPDDCTALVVAGPTRNYEQPRSGCDQDVC